MEPSPKENQNTSQFERLLASLAADGIDFAVVGGLAVIFNGYERLTLDLDILVNPEPQNIERLLSNLRGWGEGWARELGLADFGKQEGAIRLCEDFELDIFTQMSGQTINDFRPRLRRQSVGGKDISYLAPEDLLALKKQSLREKDKVDVAALTEIMRRRESKSQ